MDENISVDELIKKVDRLEKMVYPYVGISKDMLSQVILFTSPNTGVNINGKGWQIGKYGSGWDENSFIPFYGEIHFNSGKVVKCDDSEHSENKWESKNG